MTKLSPGRQEYDSGSDDDGEVVCGDEGVVTLALGNAWYHSVNTRLLLKHRKGMLREVQ